MVEHDPESLKRRDEEISIELFRNLCSNITVENGPHLQCCIQGKALQSEGCYRLSELIHKCSTSPQRSTIDEQFNIVA
jgi:hypothetical protein